MSSNQYKPISALKYRLAIFMNVCLIYCSEGNLTGDSLGVQFEASVIIPVNTKAIANSFPKPRAQLGRKVAITISRGHNCPHKTQLHYGNLIWISRYNLTCVSNRFLNAFSGPAIFFYVSSRLMLVLVVVCLKGLLKILVVLSMKMFVFCFKESLGENSLNILWVNMCLAGANSVKGEILEWESRPILLLYYSIGKALEYSETKHNCKIGPLFHLCISNF